MNPFDFSWIPGDSFLVRLRELERLDAVGKTSRGARMRSAISVVDRAD